MSTFGVLAIKGDHLAGLSDLLLDLGYNDLNEDKLFDTWVQFENFYEENFQDMSSGQKLWKVFWVENNWTIMYDPELVDLFGLESLSYTFNREVLTFFAQTTSSTYGFSKYTNSQMIREFVVQDNQISSDIGPKIRGESKIKIDQSLEFDELIDLAKCYNIEINPETLNAKFILKFIEVSDDKPNNNENIQTEKKSSWWKFW